MGSENPAHNEKQPLCVLALETWSLGSLYPEHVLSLVYTTKKPCF